jgi:hypothetical protein
MFRGLNHLSCNPFALFVILRSEATKDLLPRSLKGNVNRFLKGSSWTRRLEAESRSLAALGMTGRARRSG